MNSLLSLRNIGKSFGGLSALSGIFLDVEPGEIVGIIGPNGAGKTTLFKLIAGAAGQKVPTGAPGGEEAIVLPDEGTIKLGETVKLTYVDQMRGKLDPEKTVYEQLSGGADLIKLGAMDQNGRGINGPVREVNARAYCSWFNFSGADQSRKVGVLSGGERNRLNLAMMVKEAANVLLLDEPTNDLDVNTMRALEDLDLLSRFSRAAVGFSIPTNDDRFRQMLEPGADPVDQRLDALEAFSRAGVFTAIVIQPIMPMDVDALVEYNGRWLRETVRVSGSVASRKWNLQPWPALLPHFDFNIPCGNRSLPAMLDVRGVVSITAFRLTVDSVVVYSEGRW